MMGPFKPKRLRGQHYQDHASTDLRSSQASVSELLPLQRMFGNMLVLKDGSYRMIMKTGAVNIDLMSEREQMMILHAFGELLNTLQVDFPVTFLLHATQLDTERYVREYRERLSDPTLSPQMRNVIQDHIDHFYDHARNNYLLDRTYLAIVPYYGRRVITEGDGGVAADMPGGGAISRLLDSSAAEKRNEQSYPDMEKARIQLQNRCSLIAGGLSRMSIKAEILNELAVLRLLHEMYNPGRAERQKISHSGHIGTMISTHRVPDPTDVNEDPEWRNIDRKGSPAQGNGE